MDTRYSNPGKILREWFPEQTVTQGSILLWTLVYLVNLVVVLLVQYHMVYTILPSDIPTDNSRLFQTLQEKARFENYEFLDVEHSWGDIQVLCRNEDGQKVMVHLKQHGFFRRYALSIWEPSVTDGKRIDLDGLMGNRYVVVNGDRFTEEGGYTMHIGGGREVTEAMLLTLIPFLVEILIFNRIRALLR